MRCRELNVGKCNSEIEKLMDAAEAKWTTYHRLLDDPPVYHIWSFGSEAAIRLCARETFGKPFYVFMSTAWYVPQTLGFLREFSEYTARHYPQATLIILCQPSEDVRFLQSLGFKALHVHQNAFLDERLFYPKPGVSKLYSAVYNGAMKEFKRHWLAWNVPKIAVITRFHIDNPDYHREVGYITGYRNLAYCNLSASGLRNLSAAEVAEILSQSHCGLILSATEGGCFASAEYLLSGIPVVSTPSQGGRDELFDPSCVWIVPPEEQAVEHAVEATIDADLDPFQIREITMERIRVHRHRFIHYLSELSGRDLFKEATRDGWLPSFVNKLENFRNVEEGERTPPFLSWPR
jgi:glycosyltransferase involved in cell wall biosynthesis